MGERNVDRELVKKVQQGDKSAFDLLVRKYQFKIVKLISRYVHDPSEALDVAQEAFLKAYRALPGFRGESAFYTWLYRIAINTAKNYIVAQGRRPPGSDIDAQEAEKIGLVTQVVPHDDLLTASKELAHKIAVGPSLAIELTKRALYRGLENDLDKQLEFESYAQGISRASEDRVEGITALREKRPPVFKGM